MTQPDEIEVPAEEPVEDENFELTEDLYVARKEPLPTNCPLCHSTIDLNHKRMRDPVNGYGGRDKHTCSMCC